MPFSYLKIHIFSPIFIEEAKRIIKDDGILIIVSPGKKHLYELKELLYSSPYYNKIEEEYKEDGTIEKEIKGNIVFNNVSMKYDKENILENISFELHEGETLGIVGKSGSGKTSIVNLLTRLYDYSSGSITVDGVELKDYSKKCIRENMGVVLQDAYIFSKSIKDNILVLIAFSLSKTMTSYGLRVGSIIFITNKEETIKEYILTNIKERR